MVQVRMAARSGAILSPPACKTPGAVMGWASHWHALLALAILTSSQMLSWIYRRNVSSMSAGEKRPSCFGSQARASLLHSQRQWQNEGG